MHRFLNFNNSDDIEYTGTSNGGNGTPLSCSQNISQIIQSTCDPNSAGYNDCIKNVQNNYCKPCTLLKVLTNKDEVYEGWVNPTVDESSNGTVIACASGALDSSAFFAARARRKNGANLVDIDKMIAIANLDWIKLVIYFFSVVFVIFASISSKK